MRSDNVERDFPWCLTHDTYLELCAARHDPPNRNDLPDPWPDSGPDDYDKDKDD